MPPRLLASHIDRLRVKLQCPPQMSAAITADGILVGAIATEHRLSVSYDSLAPSLIAAVLSAEDKRFFRHRGIDWLALLRASFRNMRAGTIVQGGSTITQQLARNAVLKDTRRTLKRKALEAAIAKILEGIFSKDEILEAYLNACYFGHGVFGVRLAALSSFGKEPSDLDTEEAAYLAGLLRGPARYCSCCRPESARSRTRHVLALMAKNKTPSSYRRSGPVRRFERRSTLVDKCPWTAQYFLDCVKQWLLTHCGTLFPAKPLIVTTTLDITAQLAVESACQEAWRRGYRGRLACVVQNSCSGAILGLAGGVRYSEQPFNCAINARLQPGSLIKPFILAAAIEAGISPERVYRSAPLVIEQPNGTPWNVRNFGDIYRGPISLSEALIYSDNSVYVQLTLDLGLRPISDVLRRVDVSTARLTPAIATGSLAPGLAPLRLCTSYCAFASRGFISPATPVMSVATETGEFLYRHQHTPFAALSPTAADLVSSVLREVPIRGTGRFDPPLSDLHAKTGTTDTGAWYASYDQSFQVLTWVDTASSPPPASWGKAVTAGLLAERIWRLLRESDIPSAKLFGAFRGVDRLNVRDLLWVNKQFM